MEQPKRSDLRIIARKNGGSIQITLPKDICDLMKIDDGTELDVDLEDKKYGKFLALWNYAAQKEEYERQNTSDKYDNEKGETWKGMYRDMRVGRKNKEE